MKLMKSGTFKLLMVVSLLLVVITGCNAKKADTKEEKLKEAPVKVSKVTKDSLTLDNEIIGTIKPEVEVTVMPKTAAELISLSVKKGDKVSKGQLLGMLEDKDLVNAVRLEEAGLQQSQAQLKSAQATVQSSDQTASLKIRWDDAKKNLERVKALFDAGAMSQQEYDNAVSAEKSAGLAYNQAISANKQTQVGVEAAQAGINSAQLRVKQAKDRLADTKITSPVAGVISDILVDEGNIVSPQAPLLKIVSITSVTVNAKVSADQLPLFKAGAQTDVELPALNQKVKGTVKFISPAADETGLYTIEATIDNKENKIKPGMSAKIIIPNIIVQDALLVPTDAIIEQSDKAIIFLVKDGKAVEKEIEIVESQTEFSAVKGDIQPDDVIVIKGQTTLTNKQPVKIMKEGR